TMNDYANHTQFSQRNISSRMRMYYQLFLYYHMARKNTSFYPNLFKALREDPLALWKSPNQGVLKFAEKACEIAQEDLTDFFRAWGFFEPVDNVKISDYGTYYMTVTQEEIDATLAKLAKYPKKNTEILFIEDRVTPLKTTGFLTTPGLDRKESAAPGEYANMGQFTDYQGTPSRGEYNYIQSDTLFAAIGKGGVGFIVKDKDDKIIYGSNTYSFCVPTSLLDENISIYSIDADGMTHKLEKAGSGSKTINMTTAGTLPSLLDDKVLHVKIIGKINGTDIAYLRKLSNEKLLCSIDLSEASIVSGGNSYDGTNKTSTNIISTNMFANCGHLIQVILPENITSIGSGAFTHSGIKQINIPNSVLSIGGDAFAYCDKLTTVVIGEGVRSFSQGVFFSSENIKNIYLYTTSVPSLGAYFASKTPKLHVYSELVDQFEKAGYGGELCEIVGDLYHEFFADEIAFENDEVIIKKGETVKLNVVAYPEGATCDFVWENLSPDIIDVVDGKVTGITEGVAILIVTDQNNPFLMAMCFISVVNPVTAISFENEKETMKVGNTITLTPKIFPEDATAPDFVWESSNTDVATVEDGVVTAVAEGYAIIKVTTDEETPLSATCVITVKPAVDPVYEGGYSLNVKPFTLKSDKNDIDVNLKNVNELAKVDFDIYLPKNIITNDAYSVTLGTATSDNNKYQATVNKNADGSLHISCACKETNVIAKNAGAILTLGLNYLNNDQPILTDGLYGFNIDNVVATDANGVEHFVAPYYSYFKVGTNAKGEYTLVGNIPSVDLTDMETSASTTLNLENPNAMVITKTAINNSDNVIVNGICDNLILTDEATFVPECNFTATSVTFSKSISNEWHTLVLPYNCEIPEGVKAYTFYNATSTTIEFVKIDGSVIPANTPVLLKSEEGIVDASFDASNCEVSTLLGETNFKGTYSTIPAGEATGKYILNNTGTAFGKATDKAWIPAFRCFYDPITSSSIDIKDQPSDDNARSKELTIVLKDLTGIINHNLSKNEDVYNWHGFKGESKGVNAKGKKKYIK
ncbi:MAG: leucine-rich repeat protein, partial [Prevotellaceae bacterium]|nr:leucine-rich repeat protein [Candidatus Faecinaster equi]